MKKETENSVEKVIIEQKNDLKNLYKKAVSNLNADASWVLYSVVGKTLVTGKKQSIPKNLYITLSSEEKKMFKFFIDLAVEASK